MHHLSVLANTIHTPDCQLGMVTMTAPWVVTCTANPIAMVMAVAVAVVAMRPLEVATAVAVPNRRAHNAPWIPIEPMYVCR